ncbi:MAG: hypothetical protein ACLF0P_10695 [Thermoanaerobaculia bacterium]
MSKKKQKDFDAVKMMREIRDDLSRKLMTMSHEEQKRYIKEQLEAEPGQQEEESRHRSTV